MKKVVLFMVAVLAGIWGLVSVLRSVEQMALRGVGVSTFTFGQLLLGIVVLAIAWRAWRAARLA